MEFTAYAWCFTADYWDVYYALLQDITDAMAKEGIKEPAVRITGGLSREREAI